ncbi:eukaryotic release factor 3 GTPase subunit [Tritrichomonas foetus]|uniref:Eukaryotic release factor 3 GTPase subunit n=1 Tax=Tritrichomonas foetus TaxID=1144522 RepID=A0A1J4JNG7_9EUKA|nr:eukaryotic release factor 3 GTPase subunit [Tritrichomonas foetus]|eukprot:OHT00250.1 eukaryotic release factor 3 GTPase subunit [Tritrichomonas foetus]
MNLKIERPKAKTGGLQINLSTGKTLNIQKPAKLDIKIGNQANTQPPPPAEQPPAEKPKEEPKPVEQPKEEPKPKEEKPKEHSKPKEEKVKPKEELKPAEDDDYDEEEEEFKGEVLDESRKKTINLVFIGHVDAGKSTLCGHLLFEAGIVDQRTIEKYQKEAQAKGRQSWYFSWVMDLADTERAKGKTEEVGVAHFETEAHKYTVLDAPGHRSYVPQMIGGAVQADVAVLVISARTGEFESGFEKGGQTSEHLLIAKTAGVRYVICVINKMDDPTVNWSKERYDQIREKFNPFITREIGFKPDQFIYIPIAALGGGNLKEKATADAPWYTGPTLFEALDQVPMPPRNDTDAFRLPVIDRYKTKHLYAMGKIEKGVIHEGQNIIVMPSGAKGTVAGIFDDETKIRTGVPGDNIRVHLAGIDLADISSGSVVCLENNPCSFAEKAIVKLRFTPSAPNFITSGFVSMCHIHTEIVQVTFDRLIAVTGPKPEKNPKFVRAGQMVQCILKFDKPICIETFANFPQLGRFIIRHEGFTIAVGVVEKLPKGK